jgi:hypothetical protein
VRRESVQNESFAAAPGETLEIVFADGSSLTIAGGGAAVVETFTYDRSTRLGELVVRVQRGLVRVSGGVLNNTSAIRVLTPHGETRMDNATAVIAVDESRSEVALLLGKSLQVSSAAGNAVLTQPGTRIEISGQSVTPAARLPDERSKEFLAALNPGLLSGVIPQFVAEDDESDTEGSERLLVALNTVKDEEGSEVDFEFEDPNQGNDPDPVDPEPGGPVISDISLNASLGLSGGVDNLNWTADAGAIDPLAAAGGETNDSDFFWALTNVNLAGSGSAVFAGGTPWDMIESAAAAPLRQGEIEVTESQLAGDDPEQIPCSPSCSYGFIEQYRLVDEGDEAGSYDFVLTAPTLSTPATVPGVAFTIETAFRVKLGDDTWNFAPSGELLYRNGSTGLLRDQVGDLDDQYLMLTGFSTADFIAEFISAPSGGTCAAGLVLGEGVNEGCYRITGLEPTDPNPCTGLPNEAGCTQRLIDEAHRRTADGSAEDGLFQQGGETFTDVDGDGRFDKGNEVLLVDNNGNGELDPGDLFNDVDNDGRYEPDEEPFADGVPTPVNTILRDDRNHFVYFEARDTQESDRNFIFGSGAVLRSQAARATLTLDRFLLSPGVGSFGGGGDAANAAYLAALDACAATNDCAAGSRAFLRADTVPTGLSLYDPGLLLLNPANGSVSSLFHVDFGLSGSGAAQISTISGVFGALTYDDATNSASASARLAASSHGIGTAGSSGLVGFAAPIASSAAGGGNARLDDTSGETRVGHMLLDTCASAADPAGCSGTEHPVSSADDDIVFSSIRLASGVGTQTVDATTRLAAQATTGGFISGLQVDDTSGSVARFAALGTDNVAASNFELVRNPTANTVSARVTGWNGTAPQLGGTATNSAYIDNSRFGAADANGAAIVSGLSVIAGWPDGAAGMTAAVRDRLNGYDHLQWGFFFGDSSAARDGSTYAHLASWVTGRLTATDRATPQGSAVYEGHVFGNVAVGTGETKDVYTAVGTFRNTWDFAIRQGDVAMSFDGADYTGRTKFLGDTLNATQTAFQGTNNAAFVGRIDSSTGGRGGVLNGSFIDHPTDASQSHVGMIGRFDIGTADGSYSASGTFGAERTP